jgi:hypothetical protein
MLGAARLGPVQFREKSPILNHAVFLAFVGKADALTADRNCVRSIVTFYGSALRERTETAA